MDTVDFEHELTALLNRHSMENGSDTPDYILANYLLNCLESYNTALQLREKWYGRKITVPLPRPTPSVE